MTHFVDTALHKMRASGANPAELEGFRRRLDQLDRAGSRQTVDGSELEPAADLLRLEDLDPPSDAGARDVLDRLAVVKLNGGLGTSMGLAGPKSLLPVKGDRSFLDIIATQVLGMRRRYGSRLPLLLMNSRSTRPPSLGALSRYPELADQIVPLDFLQGVEPKLRADDLLPVDWPANPDLEWCPPGHGEIYSALAASGILDRLLEGGVRWCFVSNADNLGAVPDLRLASWMASEEIPFVLEAVRGTAADRKGGHLAVRSGRFVLRESAQVPPGDMSFGDVHRWKYFNTNNLWFDLAAIRRLQDETPGAPDLPLIVNRKRVDPTDPASTPVLQLEVAMGAAIGTVPGARAVEIPRTRFAPVKTTDDLLVNRSDAYTLTEAGEMVPTFPDVPPVVSLDPEFFGHLANFDRRFPAGPPSLRACTRLEVDGDVTFGADVTVVGSVRLQGSRTVEESSVLTGTTVGTPTRPGRSEP